ncbi:MAG: ABC transporter permease [Erysipelotrichaceae bacterium]
MKELILFSLKRRFFNKATILYLTLLFCAGAITFNLDRIILFINPDYLEPLVINCENNELETFVKNNYTKAIKIDSKSSNVIKETSDSIIFNSQYPLSSTDITTISTMINDYQYQQVNMESIKNVEFKAEKEKANEENNVISFSIVSAIYFLMISLSTIIANEVVYEKTTRLLELILTSVKAKYHFLAKMICGWSSILVQGGLGVVCVGTTFLLRYIHDNGKGLFKVVNRMAIFTKEYEDFGQLLKDLNLNQTFVANLGLIFLFLFIGIITIQIILVSLSSYVTSMEEAGNIQSPIYLLFMGMYYLSMSLNNPQSLSNGMGMYLSYMPIFSMLMMPYRLLLVDVSKNEIILSILINVLFLLVSILFGIKMYCQGILNYQKRKKLKFIK